MEFIEAKKFDEEANNSIKYFPEELVAMLSKENREIYDKWTYTEYKEKNMFFKHDFEKMFPVLEEMQSHIRGRAQDQTMNMYVKAVINQIMLERNKIVEKGTYNRTVQEQLENLTKCLNELASYKEKSTYINGQQVDIIGRESLYDRDGKRVSTVDYYEKIEEMQKMLENDKIRYPIYAEYLEQRRQKANSKYYELKRKYDKKSKIGKFIFRITGKEQEIKRAEQIREYIYHEDAARQNDSVVGLSEDGMYMDSLREPKTYDVENYRGENILVEDNTIVIPAEYEERLRLLEEEKNGRSR